MKQTPNISTLNNRYILATALKEIAQCPNCKHLTLIPINSMGIITGGSIRLECRSLNNPKHTNYSILFGPECITWRPKPPDHPNYTYYDYDDPTALDRLIQRIHRCHTQP